MAVGTSLNVQFHGVRQDCSLLEGVLRGRDESPYSYNLREILPKTIWIVDAHRDDGRRFVVRADEILSAFVELEREVLTVTFYLESNHSGADDQ
jgi:hypothetical protein